MHRRLPHDMLEAGEALAVAQAQQLLYVPRLGGWGDKSCGHSVVTASVSAVANIQGSVKPEAAACSDMAMVVNMWIQSNEASCHLPTSPDPTAF